MKKIIKTLTTVLLVMLLCLLGCNFTPDYTEGKGFVQLKIVTGRTILPDFAFPGFELTFTPTEGGSPVIFSTEDGDSITEAFELDLGNYAMYLELYNNAGDLVAWATEAIVEITDGQITEIEPILEFPPFETGIGTVSWNLSIFEDFFTIVDIFQINFIPLFETDSFTGFPLDIVSSNITSTSNIPAGSYLAIVSMEAELITANVGFARLIWSDIIQVYPGLVTTLPITIIHDIVIYSGFEGKVWIVIDGVPEEMVSDSLGANFTYTLDAAEGTQINFSLTNPEEWYNADDSDLLKSAWFVPDEDIVKVKFVGYGESYSGQTTWELEEDGEYTITLDAYFRTLEIELEPDVSDLERIVVEGETLVHYYPTMTITPGGTHGTWNGVENSDGSFTITTGGIRYSFDAITDAEYDLDDYDFVAVHYTASDVEDVVYKHYNRSSPDYTPFSGNITNGTDSYLLALRLALDNGFAIQKWQAGTGDTTIKINKLVFTQGDRGTLTLNSDGGNINATTHAFVVGLPLDLPTPSKDGKVFTGWHDGSSIIPVTAVATVEMKNITLTAQWDDPISAPMVIVDFKATGSTTNTTVTGVQNTGGSVVYTGGPAPETTGFEFTHAQGWGNDWVKFTVTLPDSVTLFAYDRITFDITYISGDLTYKTMSIAAGAPIIFTGQAQGIPAESVVATRSTGGPTAGQVESLDLALNKTVTTGITGQNIEFGIAIPAGTSGGLGGDTKFAISNFRLLQEGTIIEPTPVEGITITPKLTNIIVGEAQELTATINPGNATNKTVTWESSDPTVATITGTGLSVTLNAISVGNATITVTSQESSSITDSFTITVDPIIVDPVPVESIAITPKPANILVGATLPLTATIDPSDADNQAVTWESSDPTVATITGTGLTVTLNAISVGEATITVTSQESSSITDSFTITVDPIIVDPIPVGEITISPKTTTSILSGATLNITATVTPSDATNKAVIWSVEPAGVITLSKTDATSGEQITVTALETTTIKTATITVTSDEDPDITDSFTITVDPIEEDTGNVNITITDAFETNANIILTRNESVERGDIFEASVSFVTPPDATVTYSWRMNGSTVVGNTSNSFLYQTTSSSDITNYGTVIVTINGTPYAKDFEFKVN